MNIALITLIGDIIFYIISSLSLLSLLIIIISYIFQKSLQIYTLIHIFHLSLTTLVSTILLLIPKSPDKVLCNSQAFCMLCSDLSQYIWAFLINNSMYTFIVHFETNNPDQIPITRKLGDLLFGYIFPFSYSILFYSVSFLGDSGEYCWIESKKIGAITVTYLIILIIICANIYYAVSIVLFIKRLNVEDKEIAQNFQYRLLFYPIIQMACTLPACIMRLLDLLIKFEEVWSEVFYYIGMNLFACQGIVILFIFKDNIHWLKKVICHKKNEEDAKSNENDEQKNVVRNFSDGTLLFDMPHDVSIFDD